jgi:hypothetical protein
MKTPSLRRLLVGAVVLAVVGFAIAAILGNHHHGLRQAVADIAWTCFLVGLLATIVFGIATAVASVRGRRGAY